MRTDTAIKVTSLGKKYQLGQKLGYMTLRDRLGERFAFGRKAVKKAQKRELWALKKVSFEVKRGEVLGVIGRNGAGKSTLLKIMAEITAPTTGEVMVRGRTGALLEVGTGFSMELTGRENVYLNGSILGMKRKEITRKFDQIVEFAGVEKFIDTPVKRYSTGMYVRLAFAVAAHLEPDILLVDEVLSVGDVEFQKKSLGKMNEAAQSGKTVLFVSHNMTAIEGLCDRVVWLEKGRIVTLGAASKTVAEYLKANLGKERGEYYKPTGKTDGLINWVKVVTPEGKKIRDITDPVVIELEVENKSGDFIDAWLTLSMSPGMVVFSSSSLNTINANRSGFGRGKYHLVCTIPGNLLQPGEYGVGVRVLQNKKQVTEELENVVSFSVADSARARAGYFGQFPGVIRPKLDWQVKKKG